MVDMRLLLTSVNCPKGDVEVNRAHWDEQAAWYAEGAARLWDAEPRWGIFGVSEAGPGMSGRAVLPDVAGLDVVELGCGTGYDSGWCLRRGARRAVGDVAAEVCERLRQVVDQIFRARHAFDLDLVGADGRHGADARQVGLRDARAGHDDVAVGRGGRRDRIR